MDQQFKLQKLSANWSIIVEPGKFTSFWKEWFSVSLVKILHVSFSYVFL